MGALGIADGNFNTSGIIAGLIFGVFGVYFLKRGKKEGSIQQIGIGLALLIYPYLFENSFLLWGVGVALCFVGFRFS